MREEGWRVGLGLAAVPPQTAEKIRRQLHQADGKLMDEWDARVRVGLR